VTEEVRNPLNEPHAESEAEQVIGAYLSEYLELEEDLGVRPSLEEFAKKVPEHLRERFRTAVQALLWLEPLRSRTPSPVSGPSRAEAELDGTEQFGDYVLRRWIAAGTMGTVYEAVHRTLKRRVALKVMAPWLASQPGYRERFLREAQAAARLHHTNIAPVFEVGEHAGRLFYAMHFVDGVPLDRILAVANERRSHRAGESKLDRSQELPPWAESLVAQAARSGGVPVEEVVRWGIQIASALHHAHVCGVVHRDIKPSNLLLDADGRIWLVDFGLAALFDDPSLTRPGAMVGTPRYMSPEQARGEPVGPAADIYALGAVLYEALCLRPLIPGESVEEVLRRIRDDAPRLSLPDHVPPSLRVVLLRCLESDPGRRYRSAAELLEDLRRVARGEPVRGMRFVLLRRFLATCRRYKGTVATAAVLGALALGLAVWRHVDVTRAWRRAEQSARQADEALRLSRKRLGETLLADARSLLNSSWAGRVPRALGRLRAAEPFVAEFSELRPRWKNLLTRALQTPDLIAQPLRFPPIADPVAQLLGGPSASISRPVSIVDALPDPVHAGLLVITSDGVLAEVRRDVARALASAPPGATRLVGANPDAIWVAGDTGVWRLGRDNGAAAAVLDTGPPDRIAFHPQGGVAVVSARSLWVVRDTTRFTLALPDGGAPVETLAWDRAGKRLFVGDRSGRLLVYSVELRRRVAELDLAATAGTAAHVTACSVLPTGEVVVGLSDGSVRLLSATLHVVDTFRGHRDSVRWVVPLRDGLRLLSCDGREFLLWAIPTGELLAPRLQPGGRIVQVAPDADQDEVIFRTQDGAWQRLGALPPEHTVRVCKASDATLVVATPAGDRRIAWVDRAGRVGIVEIETGGFDARVFPLVAPARTVASCGDGVWVCSANDRELHWIETGTGRHRRWNLESAVRSVYPLLPRRAVAVTENGSAYLVDVDDGLDRLPLDDTVRSGCAGQQGPSGASNVYLLLGQGRIVGVDASGRVRDGARVPPLAGARIGAVLFPWFVLETEDAVWVANAESGHADRVVAWKDWKRGHLLAASIVPAAREEAVLYRVVIRSAPPSGAQLTLLCGSVKDTSGGLARQQVEVGLWSLLIQSVRGAAFDLDGETLWLFGGPRERGRSGPGLLEIWKLAGDPRAPTPLQGSVETLASYATGSHP